MKSIVEMQVNTGIVGDTEIVLYAAEDGKVWARAVGEFSDGRFELVDPEEDYRWYYGFGTEPESYHAAGDSRDEAISAALDESGDSEKMTIALARPRRLRDDIFQADNVFERFCRVNEEMADEDGYLDMEATPEQDAELEAALNSAFATWRARHGLGRAWQLEIKLEEVIDVPQVGAP